MNTNRLRECLEVLGWSQRALGRILSVNEATARGWARGREPIPQNVADWLEKRAAHAEMTPPPGQQVREFTQIPMRCVECDRMSTIRADILRMPGIPSPDRPVAIHTDGCFSCDPHGGMYPWFWVLADGSLVDCLGVPVKT